MWTVTMVFRVQPPLNGRKASREGHSQCWLLFFAGVGISAHLSASTMLAPQTIRVLELLPLHRSCCTDIAGASGVFLDQPILEL